MEFGMFYLIDIAQNSENPSPQHKRDILCPTSHSPARHYRRILVIVLPSHIFENHRVRIVRLGRERYRHVVSLIVCRGCLFAVRDFRVPLLSNGRSIRLTISIFATVEVEEN